MSARKQDLTVGEAAKIMRVNPETIRRMVRRDELDHFRIGRKIRIPRHEIDAYMHTLGATRRRDEEPEGPIRTSAYPDPE